MAREMIVLIVLSLVSLNLQLPSCVGSQVSPRSFNRLRSSEHSMAFCCGFPKMPWPRDSGQGRAGHVHSRRVISKCQMSRHQARCLCRRELLQRTLLQASAVVILPLAKAEDVSAAQFATSETWGNQGTLPEGREFAARAVRELLRAKRLPTILQLNEAQQVLIEAWSVITCFSLFHDFRSCPGGRDGWKSMLLEQVEKLQEPAARPSSDAYEVINTILLPALGDRYALHLLPQVLEEVEEIAAGDQVVGLGIAFVQPPSPSPGLRQRLKVLTVVPGSLAEKAGIRYGDRLVSIDGQDVGGMRGRDPGVIIPGPVGSRVAAVFQRESQAEEGKPDKETFKTVRAFLERQPMAADVVSFSWLEAGAGGAGGAGARGGRVGYLSVLTFAGPPVAAPASSLLAPLTRAQPPAPLVIDLRGNAGGSLTEAQVCLSVSLPLCLSASLPLCLSASPDRSAGAAGRGGAGKLQASHPG